MNSQDDLPDESDTSDEDYNPAAKEDDVSEIESDGDPEEPYSDCEENTTNTRKRKTSNSKTKKSKCNSNENIVATKENKIQVAVKEEEKKKKDDDLWADFMKDTGFISKSNSKLCSNSSNNTSNKAATIEIKPHSSVKLASKKVPEKVKVKQIFEFAGEEIEIEKEVASDSAEARLLNTSSNDSFKVGKAKRTSGFSGIGNVLSQLSKKPKISTLEKTKLDWDRFKKEENLDEELKTYNKGKDGYLERQEFLERADLRRFEIEKDLRTIERNKRFNSTA